MKKTNFDNIDSANKNINYLREKRKLTLKKDLDYQNHIFAFSILFCVQNETIYNEKNIFIQNER